MHVSKAFQFYYKSQRHWMHTTICRWISFRTDVIRYWFGTVPSNFYHNIFNEFFTFNTQTYESIDWFGFYFDFFSWNSKFCGFFTNSCICSQRTFFFALKQFSRNKCSLVFNLLFNLQYTQCELVHIIQTLSNWLTNRMQKFLQIQ